MLQLQKHFSQLYISAYCDLEHSALPSLVEVCQPKEKMNVECSYR